jgi:ABC-type nitrate/sulfonate/bicarbonate transport system substrate-binding protein
MPTSQKYRLSARALVLSAIVLAALGCGSTARSAASKPDGYEKSVLRYEGFSGTVLFPELAENLGYLAPLKLEYVGNTISGPQNIQNVVTRDIDFGGAFNGSVIKLIAAKAPIKAVIGYYGADEQTWSGFYVLEDSPLHTAKDLLGKKVAVNTLGAHSEFMLKEYLFRNGLSDAQAEQVTLLVVPPVNSEQTLRQHQVEVATLSSIFREKALERGGLRLLFSDYELYGAFTAGSYVMTNAFIRDNPNTVRKFVEATGRAIEWARNTPRDQVITRFEKLMRARHRTEDPSAIHYWKSTTVASKAGVLGDRDFQIWIDWLVKDGQLAKGQVKASDVYTTQFQSALN